MASKIPLYGLVMAAAAGLFGSPGVALSHSDAHNLQIYAGEILGDRLTAIRLSGRTPVLNDNATFGARYTYGLSQWFALQLSAGYSPGRVARVASGNTTLDLTTADLDLLFDVTPTLTVNGRHLMLYTELGAGYAWVSLHHPLLGSIDSMPVRLTASNDYTANAGLGVQYYLTANFFINLDARYRYMSRLVNRYSQALNTAETTFGIGYRF